MTVPSVLVSGQQVEAAITAFVKGADSDTQVQLFSVSGTTTSFLGCMRDDGLGGDQTAGDQIYTIMTTLSAPAASSLPMRIVASIGSVSTQIDFSTQVVQKPSFASSSDLNLAEANLFNTAIQTRTLLLNRHPTSGTFLHDLGGNLSSMYAQFSGIVGQNPALQSSSTKIIGQLESEGGQRSDTVAGAEGDFLAGPLLAPSRSAVSCNQLVGSLGPYRGSPDYPAPLDLHDQRLLDFADEMVAICPSDPQCSSLAPLSRDDLLGTGNAAAVEWVREYMAWGKPLPTPIAGCGAGIANAAAGAGIKVALQQFTDFSGDALTSLLNGGYIVSQAIGQATSYLVGCFVDSAGAKQPIIAQVAPSERFSAPTGTYNLAWSLGGDTPNATVSNTPVYANSSTIISPSPGVTVTVTPPVIYGVNPPSGPVGTPVLIKGAGFNTEAAGNQVTFSGSAAQVGASTSTSIQTTVPLGATSGPVTVTTASGTTISSVIFTVSNPVPAINSLSPDTLPVGSGSQTLTINGSGFLPTSYVTFNTISHDVTFVNANQITISLTSSDLAIAGTFLVLVTNPPPGGGISNSNLTVSTQSGGVTEKVLYAFHGGIDGSGPGSDLIFDKAGNLYGTTSNGGVNGAGTVFRLTLSNGGWTKSSLYSFAGGSDGALPSGGLVFDAAGNLYGTTINGGSNGMGTVFKLTSANGGWTESVLHSFAGGGDGAHPWAKLILDQAGTLYGTTNQGGPNNYGTVFELTSANGEWKESVLYAFAGGSDGLNPRTGLVFDAAGNLYGTTSGGGRSVGFGTVFQLKPSSGGWSKNLLYAFTGANDGLGPEGLVFDGLGNLYGTTFGPFGSAQSGGTVFELTPTGSGWTENILYTLTYSNGASPYGTLVFDSAGNLYGTTGSGGAIGYGTVFKLARSNAGWTQSVLYSFTGAADGESPLAGVILDSAGNLYGTTPFGGDLKAPGGSGAGVVFELERVSPPESRR